MPHSIAKTTVLSVHAAQIREHGGLDGLRDEGLLDSALARPRNSEGYGNPDLAFLAGSYAFGLARNHPFLDGNKRTSFTICLTFLALNGFDLRASDDEKIATWLALAAGLLDEEALSSWVRDRLIRSEK